MRDKIKAALKGLDEFASLLGHESVFFDNERKLLREALQSTADDSEPITAEWCMANGAQETYPGFFSWRWAGRSVTYDSFDTSVGVKDGYNFAELWHITTRGRLRHLMAAIGEDEA